MMNQYDVIKGAFMGGYASGGIGVPEILVCMAVTILMSGYLFLVYRAITRNAFYNKNFNLSLIALAVITASIILTIQSNIVISLGMVGALSIVRFRTAVKDPMDLVFLFWAISIGIICGAGYALIAVLSSVVLTVIMFLFERLSIGVLPTILLVNTDDYSLERPVLETVGKHCSIVKVKARNVTKGKMDMAIEVRTREESVLLKELMAMDSVLSVSLLDHEGEVTG